MTQQQPSAREIFGDALDSLEGILKWLGRVATIAIGTCLGLILFVLVVTTFFAGALGDVNINPRSPSYTSTPR